jgi:toxin secretion/phage lysis holin
MDVYFKSVISVIGGIISWAVGGLGVAFAVLLGLMAIDFITGMMVGSVGPGLSSSTGKKGALKKVYILLLIAAVYMVQRLVPELQAAGYAGDGVAVAYGVLEFLSIIENGGKLGVPIGPLAKIIAVLKPTGGHEDAGTKQQ